MTQVLLLELNEVNFDYVRAYGDKGFLPALTALMDSHGLSETTSEARYEELEPWIQWVTAHTGQSFSEHGVFRLGDIVRNDIPQIWEVLEAQGLKVGAISPMNANNRCERPVFFVPDPWTQTKVTGSPILANLHAAIAQAVADNTQSRITLKSLAHLLAGLARYARPSNYGRYAAMVGQAFRGRPWGRAMVLDQLLADVFIGEVGRTKPAFASLFLNAAAHIQHHYMFNAGVYDGPHRNPGWYVDPEADPVLDIYRQYDHIVAQVLHAFPKARLLVATGLHQIPCSSTTFYWRLKDHASFLARAGVPFLRVEPRMSRDFIVFCQSADDAQRAQTRLEMIEAADGRQLFSVDNRGADLFVELVWPDDIDDAFECHVGNERLSGFKDEVTFVAIKNGMHDGIGYLVDTGVAVPADERLPLAEIPSRIASAFGLSWSPVPA